MSTANRGSIAAAEAGAWVSMPSESETKALVVDHPYARGFVPGMIRLVFSHPKIGPLFAQMYGQIMFSEDGELDRREREMVATAATVAQDCFYWTQSHAEFLRLEGGTDSLAEAVRNNTWEELEELSERDRALLRVAQKLSGEPTKMVERDWQPLRDLGFNDEALLEVAHVVGVFNHLTRLADGMGLELDSPTAESMSSGNLLGT